MIFRKANHTLGAHFLSSASGLHLMPAPTLFGKKRPPSMVRFARETSNGNRQRYADHVRGVEERAVRFARRGDWARFFARYHDLGKLRQKWQDELGENPPPHSPHAARVIKDRFGPKSYLFLAPVWSHHSRLRDVTYLDNNIGEWAPVDAEPPMELPDDLPEAPPEEDWGFALRMVTSACVDADRLDAEAFSEGPRAEYDSIETLWCRFRKKQKALIEETEDTDVNQVREAIYRECVEKADVGPGYYSATIPTGGGKTRTLAGFALRHALEHGHERVVVVVPYTSIIEQNAKEYRKILDPDEAPDAHPGNVLEHHSRAQLGNDQPGSTRHQKAAENWDAPFIITTAVQFFESLWASRASRLRKIHRLDDSVIVLDEMQSLPARLLRPCKRRLDQLLRRGATVVCSTATNPDFEVGGRQPHELISDPEKLSESLGDRVTYKTSISSLSHKEVAERLSDHRQVLCVLNTVEDALQIGRLAGGDVLTTRLCPIDRRRKIESIKTRLEEGEPVCLVSTQLIEAGVDVDFPTAFRAVGPLVSIVQTAGRCNREGKLEKGTVHVFELEDESTLPIGAYRVATSITREHLGDWDLKDPSVPSKYFDVLTGSVDTDKPGVLDKDQKMRWNSAAQAFQMIPDTITTLVPRNDEARRLIGQVQTGDLTRQGWRRLQKYVVSLYDDQADEAEDKGRLEYLQEDVALWGGPYDEETGVQL